MKAELLNKKNTTELKPTSNIDLHEAEMSHCRLIESENKYRTLVETASDYIINIDKEYKVKFINHAFEGFTPQDMPGKKVLDFLPKEHQNRVKKIYTDVFKTGNAAAFEAPCGKNGNWYNFRVGAIKHNGKVVGLVNIATDISEKKKTEEATRLIEERYHTVIAAVAEGIVLQNANGEIITCNAKAEQILGLTKEQMLGRTSLDSRWQSIHEDGSPFQGEMHPAMISLKTGKKCSNVIMGVYKPGGELGWISINSEPLFHKGQNKPYAAITCFTDLTEKINTLKALRTSEERYKHITEAVTDYIFTVKIEGGKPERTFHHETCLAITGYSKDEFEKDPYLWLNMVVKEDQNLVREHAARLIAGSKIEPIEHRIHRKNGQIRWVRNTPVMNYDHDGRLVSYEGLITDITERKLAELALREKQQFIEQVLNTISSQLYIYDLIEQRNVFANSQITQLLGYSTEEMQKFGNKILPTLMHPDDLIRIAEHFKKIMSGKDGEIYEFEYRMRHRDGDWRWFLSRDSIFKRSPDGQVQQIVGAATDITERKQAEDILRESERRYFVLFEESPIPLWEEDFSEVKQYLDKLQKRGIEDFPKYFDKHPEFVKKCAEMVRIMDVNKAVLQQHTAQLKSDLLVGLPQLFDEESYRVFKEELLTIISGKTHLESEIAITTLSGEKRVIKLGWVVVPGYEDTLSKVFISTVDITELKSTEQALRESEEKVKKVNEELEQRVRERTAELEAVNKELESFAYSVSHDLRAPLRGIDGFSYSLLEEYPDKLDDQGKDYLQRVRSASQRMGELIDALLSLSRVTRGDMSREQVQLSNMVEDIFNELKQQHPERNVKTTIAAGLTVQGDNRLLRVAMTNLLGNAWKFTKNKSRAVINFGVAMENMENIFYVKDNGAGFNMAYANKLFKPFHRLHGPKEYEGTGIGLATVQRIINRHGGKIWAKSGEGQGATFYFTIP